MLLLSTTHINWRLPKLCTLCMMLFPTLSAASVAKVINIADLRWENRVIVAFATTGSPEADALRQWVDTNPCGLKNRDIIVFAIDARDNHEITGTSIKLDTASSTALRQRRRYPDSPIEILLIGKDGGIKASSSELTELNGFVALIDTMPMRRQEAAQDKGCS